MAGTPPAAEILLRTEFSRETYVCNSCPSTIATEPEERLGGKPGPAAWCEPYIWYIRPIDSSAAPTEAECLRTSEFVFEFGSESSYKLVFKG